MKRYVYTFLFAFLLIFYAQPRQAADVADLQGQIKGLFSSFTANFSYSTSSGELYSGKIYYQYPDKLHVRLSDGRIIATNGRFLWTYNSASRICAKQTVLGSAGGLFGFLQGDYTVHADNGRYTFKWRGETRSEISIKVDGGILKSVQFKSKNDVTNASFSNVVTDTSMKASLFSYKPDPDAQLIENPLNRIGL